MKPVQNKEGKVGRPEILTKSLARQIARLIETMPDQGLEVTWDNVVALISKDYGHTIGRRQLSQKSWDGVKIVAKAFNTAKAVQKRMKHDGGSRYSTTSRQNLMKKISGLEARIEQLSEELEAVRAINYESLDRLRVTDVDLRAATGAESDAK